MADLEKEFDQRLFELYRRADTEAGYQAKGFFQMLNERRGRATAKALINASRPSDGFTRLFEKNRIDLTVEAEVIGDPRWHELFLPEELKKARLRLVQYRYSPATLVVLTFKSVETCLEVGGTQAWELNRDHALDCDYVVLCRNAIPEAEGDEKHRSAFLIAHIADVVPSDETPGRWNVTFDRYARIDIPELWNNRNPVHYTTLKDLGINPDEIQFKAMPAKGKPKADPGYWAFVCNPQKWAIDRFLASGITDDTWGVRPSDASLFAPGQLAVVRVGVDRRSMKELNGAKPLVPGIYAICQVESIAAPGTGAGDDFWSPDDARAPGWPTVRIKYLKTFADRPLTIERLREIAPEASSLMLNGFQAASFPISETDFLTILDGLSLDLDDLPISGDASDPSEVARLSDEYANAAPVVIERLSRQIERGPVGAEAKKANGNKCQICEKLGKPSLGFKKRNGTHYVEAHHVVHVSTGIKGVLAPSNVITVCPNHHRELHYGDVTISDLGSSFQFEIGDGMVVVPKFGAGIA
jgi:hypothetical protein